MSICMCTYWELGLGKLVEWAGGVTGIFWQLMIVHMKSYPGGDVFVHTVQNIVF